ncbi:helix-turn-helix domain-containing protein [Nocardia concava]|uniref:helix-turn-helix domain-containing protein n=1 Tax=Nocardia concava TaxID=257281 RepID=UPI000A05427A
MSDTQEILARLRTEPTISIPEYGRLIGVSRASAYVYAREGQIPTIRVGRCVRVPSAAVLRQLRLDQESDVQGQRK